MRVVTLSPLCLPVNKTRRVQLSSASLLKVAPTGEERKIIHSLFLNTLDTKYDTPRTRSNLSLTQIRTQSCVRVSVCV